MAKQLLKLRHVPEDELTEIIAMLEEHDIEFYETPAGNWGISMPALWLVNDTDYEQARALLDAYSEERLQRARQQYEELKRSGRARTFRDIARENPLRFTLYLAIVFVLAYFSIAPFIAIM